MKKIIKILIFFILLVAIIFWMFGIQIREIDVVGNEKVTDEEVISLILENKFDRSSVGLYLKNKFGSKKRVPLINTYDIEWVTPFSIIIRVNENPAIAFMKRDVRNVYFDKYGYINEVSDERKLNTIEVVGVSFKNYEKGEQIEISNKKILNAILNITSYLNEHDLNAELLEVKNDETISIFLGNIEVELGDIDNMEIKLQRLSDIFPEISGLNGTLDLSNARENMLDEQYIFKKKQLNLN